MADERQTVSKGKNGKGSIANKQEPDVKERMREVFGGVQVDTLDAYIVKRVDDKLDLVFGDLSAQNVKINDIEKTAADAKDTSSSSSTESSAAKAEAGEAKRMAGEAIEALTVKLRSKDHPEAKEETKTPKELVHYVVAWIEQFHKMVGKADREAKEAKEESSGVLEKVNNLRSEFEAFKENVEEFIAGVMGLLQSHGMIPEMKEGEGL